MCIQSQVAKQQETSEEEQRGEEKAEVVHEDNEWGVLPVLLCVCLCNGFSLDISVVGESEEREEQLGVATGLRLAYAAPSHPTSLQHDAPHQEQVHVYTCTCTGNTCMVSTQLASLQGVLETSQAIG